MLWDLAFVVFTQNSAKDPSQRGGSKLGIAQFWSNVARYSNPNGPAASDVPRTPQGYNSTWKPEFSDGLAQLLTIWYTGEPLAVASQPHYIFESSAGCRVDAMQIEHNFTGLPRPQSDALMALVQGWALDKQKTRGADLPPDATELLSSFSLARRSRLLCDKKRA